MESRHEDNDGSDIFWPGYVDATTNLILNLLFLLTILMVAVFMFALELGRSSPTKPENPPVISKTEDTEATTMGGVPMEDADPVQENIALKLEIQRLKMELAKQVPESAQAGGLVETVEGTSPVAVPQNGLDKTLASETEIIVRFMAESIEFMPAEHDRLLEVLKPIAAAGKASISVEVPAGFSEAKRMGFYRAMSVRNLLIEMELLQENIDVSVVEGNNKANASIVRVRPR
jgi:hypothetical protein